MNVLNKKAFDPTCRSAGFTLVEILVVVAVIGILAAIVQPKLQKFSAKAKQAEAKATLRSINILAESYYTEKGVYTQNLVDLGFSQGCTLTSIDNGGVAHRYKCSGLKFYPLVSMESDNLRGYYCVWSYYDSAVRRGLCPAVWYDSWATCSGTGAGSYINCAFVNGESNPYCFTNNSYFGPHPAGDATNLCK